MICLGDYTLVGTYNENDGAEIWSYSYDADAWERVVSGGFGDANNISISSMMAVGEYLYAGTENDVSGGEVWRSPVYGDAGSWEQVNVDGFGDPNNHAVTSLAGAGAFCMPARNTSTGGELWQVELHDPDTSFLIHAGNWIANFSAVYNSHDQQYLSMWENENDGEYDDTLQAQRFDTTGKPVRQLFYGIRLRKPSSRAYLPTIWLQPA